MGSKSVVTGWVFFVVFNGESVAFFPVFGRFQAGGVAGRLFIQVVGDSSQRFFKQAQSCQNNRIRKFRFDGIVRVPAKSLFEIVQAELVLVEVAVDAAEGEVGVKESGFDIEALLQQVGGFR